MYTPLLQYIQQRAHTPLSAADKALIHEAFIPKKLQKKQFLLQEGEVCRYIAFIVTGAMRKYTVDDKGQLHIINLGLEGWWVGDRESFHGGTPSIYNIDAWEPTDVLLLPKVNGYYERVNEIPAFKEMRTKLDDNNHMAQQRRIQLLTSHPADYRYEELRKTYPDFLQRFPQHLIASYLGITKETLSRLRKQSVKN